MEQKAQKPLISVIVAVYNIIEYLPRCVDSILGQSYDNLEIFLVDDGSTDGSERLCDEYAGRDPRVRVIHKENGGLSDARNAALAEAGGDYIGYVDGDDWIDPWMMEKMVTACLEADAGIAICRYDQVEFPEGEDKPVFHHTGNYLPTGKMTPLAREEALDFYLCGDENVIIYNSVWSKLFRRDVAENVRFVIGRKSEDIMYTTETFCKSERMVYVDYEGYHYVTDRVGSLMNAGMMTRRMEHELLNWRTQYAYLKEMGFLEAGDKAFFYYVRRLMDYDREFRAAAKAEQRAEEVATEGAGWTSKRCYQAIEREVRENRSYVRAVCQKDWARRSDVTRMKLFVFCPALYHLVSTLYENTVVKRKNRREQHEITTK